MSWRDRMNDLRRRNEELSAADIRREEQLEIDRTNLFVEQQRAQREQGAAARLEADRARQQQADRVARDLERARLDRINEEQRRDRQ